MSSGVCGVWAMRNGDFQAKEFPGTSQGLTDALAYCGNNGLLVVYPGNSSLTVPAAPVGVRVLKHEAGRLVEYAAGGLARADLNVREFGAKGDGTTDDAAAIMAAHNALPTSGGTIRLSPDAIHLVKSQLLFTKRVRLVGHAPAVDHQSPNLGKGPATLLRWADASFTGTMLVLAGDGSSVDDLAITSQASPAAGDGVQIKAHSVTMRHVSVMLMNGNGIRIGHSDNTNCNIWYLDHVTSRGNAGHGVYIHSDDSAAAINANAGTAISCSLNLNGANGLRIKNGQLNTFVGLHCEGNTGEGTYLENVATDSVFIGGDHEQNDVVNNIDIRLASTNCARNSFIFCGDDGTAFADGGSKTRILSDAKSYMSPGEGPVIDNGPGPGWSTTKRAHARFSGGATERMRVGIDYDGPEVNGGSPVVAAQVVASDHTTATPSVTPKASLNLCGRDTGGSSVALRAGAGLAKYAILDAPGGKLETSEDVNVVTGKVYRVAGTQVVGARGAAVADATGAGDVVAQLNALLARIRAHGLIAT